MYAATPMVMIPARRSAQEKAVEACNPRVSRLFASALLSSFEITGAPFTWPAIKRVWTICHVIARTSGYSLPKADG